MNAARNGYRSGLSIREKLRLKFSRIGRQIADGSGSRKGFLKRTHFLNPGCPGSAAAWGTRSRGKSVCLFAARAGTGQPVKPDGRDSVRARRARSAGGWADRAAGRVRQSVSGRQAHGWPAAPAMPGTQIHEVHLCVAAPYALFFVSCVSPQETPTRRRQPAKPGALCGFRDIHTDTAGRLFLCGCASTLWKRAPGTAQLQRRISTLCKPLWHTVGNPGQPPFGTPQAVNLALHWRALFAGWNLPFRAVARLQFFIPVSGQQGPLLRGIVGLPEGSRLQGKIRGHGRLLFLRKNPPFRQALFKAKFASVESLFLWETLTKKRAWNGIPSQALFQRFMAAVRYTNTNTFFSSERQRFSFFI